VVDHLFDFSQLYFENSLQRGAKANNAQQERRGEHLRTEKGSEGEWKEERMIMIQNSGKLSSHDH
jgi:hypothetical protein